MKNNLIHKIDVGTDQVEKKVDSVKRKAKKVARSFKTKFIAFLIAFGLVIIVLFGAFYTISKWYRTHDVYFRLPVIIQSPIVIKEKKPEIIIKKIIVTPTPTPAEQSRSEQDLILAQKHGKDLWRIYQLETQRGLTDYCRNNNKGWGGFGVMFDGEIVCYPTFEKAVERAEYWFAGFKPESNLVDALCTWNLGHNVVNGKVVDHQNCGYYQKFLVVND